VGTRAADQQPAGPLTVLYDGDCGFCRWSMAKILAWDRRGRLRPVALQDPEAERLLAGMDPGRRMASWHLMTPDGAIRSAGAAAPPLLRALPGGRPLAAMAGAMPGLTERLYQFVSRHRGTLGRILGERACAVEPGKVDSRRG
jgi:predicted DCC family thiol-disulfide oxidoreductase YuxK